MADGEMIIKLSEEMARRVRAAAEAVGADPVVYAERLIDEALEPDHWAVVRERAAEYDRTGESLSVDEVFDHLQARVDELQAKRG